MGHGYRSPDEQLFTPRRSGKCGQEAFKTIQERLSLDALTMQEKEELNQAIDEVLYIYQMVKEQEGKDWLSWTVRMPELALFSSKGSFFSASSKRTQLCVSRRRSPPIDGKVALSVCRCVGTFKNKNNFLSIQSTIFFRYFSHFRSRETKLYPLKAKIRLKSIRLTREHCTSMLCYSIMETQCFQCTTVC